MLWALARVRAEAWRERREFYRWGFLVNFIVRLRPLLLIRIQHGLGLHTSEDIVLQLRRIF